MTCGGIGWAACIAGLEPSAAGQPPLPEDVSALLAEACAAGSVSPAVYERLQAAGAFAGHGSANPIAQYSTRWAVPVHVATS